MPLFFVFCKNIFSWSDSVLIEHRTYSPFNINFIARPCSYTAGEFVLDMIEILKGRLFNDEAHMAMVMEYNYT